MWAKIKDNKIQILHRPPKWIVDDNGIRRPGKWLKDSNRRQELGYLEVRRNKTACPGDPELHRETISYVETDGIVEERNEWQQTSNLADAIADRKAEMIDECANRLQRQLRHIAKEEQVFDTSRVSTQEVDRLQTVYNDYLTFIDTIEDTDINAVSKMRDALPKEESEIERQNR